MKKIKDPVCGMDVKPGENSQRLNWKGDDYFFCNEGCRNAFEKSPEKYLKKRSWFMRKWDRYLEKLNKQTGGHPTCCH